MALSGKASCEYVSTCGSTSVSTRGDPQKFFPEVHPSHHAAVCGHFAMNSAELERLLSDNQDMSAETRREQNSSLATPEQMQSAIEASGYLLEGRIVRVMAGHGFSVEANQFTLDPAEPSKAMEIDVVGGYFEWVNEENKDTVSASVLVECKNNSQPFAFFVRRQQLTELNDNCIHYGGFPSFSMDQETKTQVPLHRLLEMKKWHHYCLAKEVATQFCTFERSGKKFKAGPNEIYSKSFSKLAAATAFNSGGAFGLHLECIQVQASYPVVVFQGPIYRVEEDNGKATLEAVAHLQLHHVATVDGCVIPVQIDVVTESAFPKLMEDILTELKTFRDRINGLYPRLLNSARDQKRVASQNEARKMFSGLRK